jgi:chromosome segregation ATPase
MLGLPGELKIMAMNLVRPYDNLAYPVSKHLKPMLDLVEFEPAYSNIMKFVFGRVMVVREGSI